MTNVLDLYNTFSGGLGGVNNKLIYPLENQSDYLGRITFTPINDQDNTFDARKGAGSFASLSADAIVTYGSLLAGLFDDREVLKDKLSSNPARKKLIDAGSESVIGINDVTDPLRETLKTAVDFYGDGEIAPAGGFDDTNLDLQTGKRVSLYLPRAIQIQDTVTYDNAFQLGLIGGAVEQALGDGGNVIGAIGGSVAREIVGLGKTFMGNTDGMSKEAAGLLSAKLAAAIPKVGTGVGGAVRSATGLTTNPNTRAIFKDVPIRNFSFAFQLIPTSQNEAIVVEKIIKRFRTELYPTALQAGGVNIGYKFPNRFQIKVKYNNREIQGIKFLPVYLQSFNATYNSASGGMHSDGRFSAVDISLTFSETRAITKKDVEGGY